MKNLPGRLELDKLVPLNVTVMQDERVLGEPFYVVWPEVDDEEDLRPDG